MSEIVRRTTPGVISKASVEERVCAVTEKSALVTVRPSKSSEKVKSTVVAEVTSAEIKVGPESGVIVTVAI